MVDSYVMYVTVRRTPQSLDFKQQKCKIMLNLLNTILKKKKIERVKSNIFSVIIVAI